MRAAANPSASPAANPVEIARIERKYSRDLFVSGAMGALVSTRVRTFRGALLSAGFTEVMLSLLGFAAPGLYPPDPNRSLKHKVIGVGLFVGGWLVGRQFQDDDC